jgi:hypothetical protein
MSSLVILLTLASWSADADVAAATAEAEQPRRYHEINNDIRDALRTEALAEGEHQRAAAVRKMCDLYRELAEDPRLESSDTLKSYKAKLWSRMTRVKRDLQRQLAREGKSVQLPEDEAEEEAIKAATRSLASQMSYLSYTMGGPTYVLEQTGGAFGGGTANDHGQELIDLIERTIQPDFWDTAGGPGSMFYYRPLMALVVRATSEVHGNVGGLLDALRRAGM